MKRLAPLLFALLLGACANSASHEVVSVSSPNDAYLSCDDIQVAKSYMRLIIAGIEKDKADITQADMVDHTLWFPLNVIAKQNNYSSSQRTASLRLQRLEELEKEKGCEPPKPKEKITAKKKSKSKKKSVSKKSKTPPKPAPKPVR
jgi:hypothetical protein